MLHILVGDKDLDYKALVAPRTSRALLESWVVPRKAHRGELAWMYIHSRGFVAIAEIATSPESSLHGRRRVYRASRS